MILRKQVAGIEVINQYIERGEIEIGKIISINTVHETDNELGYIEIFYFGSEIDG